MFRTTTFFCFLSIIIHSSIFSQQINLYGLDGFPENLKIKDAKYLDGSLFVTANGMLYRHSTNIGWTAIDLPDSLSVETDFGSESVHYSTYNEVFDINQYGQIVMRTVANDKRYLLTTDTSFSSFFVQESFTEFDFGSGYDGSKLFYIGKDTILIPNGICSDFGDPNSFISTDAGASWTSLGHSCVPEDSDYVRIGNKIHWYGYVLNDQDVGSPNTWRSGLFEFDLTSL